jgi:hypothetical protein
VRRPLALASAALAALGLYGAVASRRRRATPALAPEAPDPRAEELRRKLAESRAIVEEREEFEAAETPVDRAEPATEVDERRRAVHEQARGTARKMRDTGPD